MNCSDDMEDISILHYTPNGFLGNGQRIIFINYFGNIRLNVGIDVVCTFQITCEVIEKPFIRLIMPESQ